MLGANLWSCLIGCCMGVMAAYLYLGHLRRSLRNTTAVWKNCLVRLICVALFFGIIFHICVPAGIAGFVAFLLTRHGLLFKESRGSYGKL